MKHTGNKERALSLILTLCLVLGLLPALSLHASAAWDGSTADYTWYGDGSADTFYIGTAAELKGLANIANGQDGRESADFSGKTIVLTSDIDLNSQEWTPIGTDFFGGSFNGNFHTISNLSVTKAQTLVGLFGFTVDVIANLKVTGSITASDSSTCPGGDNGECVGGIAAACNGTIINCCGDFTINVAGVNSRGTHVGELAGWCNAIYNSRADGTIAIADSLSADALYIGGLTGTGSNSSCFVNDCSTVALPESGGAGIGEAAGTADGDIEIENFFYRGTHDICGVHDDSVSETNCSQLSDSVLKGGAYGSALTYSTETSNNQSIAAGETNAVIKALNSGRTAISDLPEGYSAKDWTFDADGYPTLNFTSAEDNDTPLVYGVSTSVVLGGAVSAACNKNGTLYLVPKPASAYTQKSALAAAAAAGGMTVFCPAGVSRSFNTDGLEAGTYQIYAADQQGKISVPSSDISLYAPAAGSDIWDGTSASYGWYGSGGQSTFYLSTAADLKGFANMVNGEDGQSSKDFYGKTVILTRDIDLGNQEWTPIGFSYKTFCGIFDGQGHIISNLYISSNGSAGFFGYLTATVVKNLTVSGNIAVTLTNHYAEYSQEGSFAGGLAYASCGCAIINCSTDVTMNVTVANIQNNHNKLCSFYIGGLVGCLTAPTNDDGYGVVNCYSRGSVTVTANNDLGYLYVGGLVGGLSKPQNSNYISVCENCYAACPVTISGDSVGKSQNKWLGAVIGGKVDECTADNCFWSTDKTSCSGIGSGVNYEGTSKALVSTGNCSGPMDGVLKGTETGDISYTGSSGTVSSTTFLDALNGGRDAITCLSDTVKAKKWKYESGVNDGYPVFDDTAPTITSFSPAAGSGDVSDNPQLALSFHEPVTGVSGKYLFVVKAEDGSVAGAVDLGSSQVNCSGSTAIITLPFSLENGTEYYIAMDDDSFESDAGVAFGGISNSCDWTFTTIPDAVPLTILNFAPSNGAIGVLNSTDLEITFNKNVTAVSGKKIYIKAASDDSTVQAITVSDTTHVSISGNAVTIALPDSFAAGTDYCVTIDSGAFQDKAGNVFTGLNDSSAWHFTTATANAHSVSGTVKNSGGTLVSGATVKVMQGSTQFGSTATTAADGTFTVYNVSNGEYNLVVTCEGRTITEFISVSDANCAAGTIMLPNDSRNSVLSVTGEDTPSVVVNGLDREAAAQTDSSCTVTMTVAKKAASDSEIQAEASKIILVAGGRNLDYLKISVAKTTDSGITTMHSLSTVQEIAVPYDFSGKKDIAVYRYHGDSAAALLALDTRPSLSAAVDGTYYADATAGKIYIYASNFSAYAIGYSVNSSEAGSSSSGSASYIIKTSVGTGGRISPSGSSVIQGGSRTFTITAENGYCISDVLVDGTSVGVVSSYTFSNVTAAHTLRAVFARTSGLPYYLDGNRNKVFIGFSTDKSGAMKYIAPEGNVILFAQNPKDFTDISGHWAKSNIDFVTQREIFVGTASNTFSPDEGMTRAMFAAVIGRLYERSYGILTGRSEPVFTDVDYDSYYGKYVSWAFQNKIMNGTGEGVFKPDREITREETAAILYRFAIYLKASDRVGGDTLSYPDASEIDAWAQEAVLYCQQTGIITGRDNGNFAPKETATRGEVTAILKRFVETVVCFKE